MMPDDEVTRQAVSDREQGDPPEPAGVATVEAYEHDGGVVLYDAENPLAWVRATHAVTLEEHV